MVNNVLNAGDVVIYRNQASKACTNKWIVGLVKEGCGVRSIARLLRVAVNTIMKRIKQIAACIKKPSITFEQRKVEVDELKTYLGCKENECWIDYDINRHTGQVIDYVISRRTKQKLGVLIKTILLSRAQKIYTDNLRVYRTLIPRALHCHGGRRINHIERYNLNLRTHLKRLSRRTICFSRRMVMLNACLRIYFWHKQ
jgi:insertion element IS1 protein InsB